MEKAEKIDERIKEAPQEAKMVSKEGDDAASQMMFDASEIEISFADQPAEREISDELAEPDAATQLKPKDSPLK